jgi:ABC-type antimicrobial peptide transport system permease subunit
VKDWIGTFVTLSASWILLALAFRRSRLRLGAAELAQIWRPTRVQARRHALGACLFLSPFASLIVAGVSPWLYGLTLATSIVAAVVGALVLRRLARTMKTLSAIPMGRPLAWQTLAAPSLIMRSLKTMTHGL